MGEDMLASLEDTVLSLDLVPLLEDMVALWEVTVLLEVTALWEALVTPWLEWQAARRPTSPCTSLCRARTGASPSPRLSDPLSLLSLTTLAPPTVSAPTGSDLLLSPPGLLATVLLLLLPMVLAMVLLAMDLLEELPMELLATVLLVTVSATASLEELPTELVLEECSTDTLATTEL